MDALEIVAVGIGIAVGVIVVASIITILTFFYRFVRFCLWVALSPFRFIGRMF